MRTFFPPFLAPLLLALFAGWCGTLAWGGLGVAAIVAALVLLSVLAASPDWPVRDPLGLGLRAGLLPWAAYAWCLLSWALSPVPRAGQTALLLLPAFLLLPGVVARALGGEEGRRRAARAIALVGLAVALWALLDAWLLGAPRPAMPLGHHNLLAAWLVLVLPLAALTAGEEGRWRWLGFVAAGLMIATVLATRSLAGYAALGAQAAWAAAWLRRRPDPPARSRRGLVLGASLLLSVGALALVLSGGRLIRMARGLDPSLRAREVYWSAGLAGIAARPLAGWGPGASGWTLAAFLEPEPGVSPPGEVVGELHSLPLALAYELGLPGFALCAALATLFVRARRRDGAERGEIGWTVNRAGLLGLVGGAVASLGSAAVSVTALPVAAAVAAGFALGAPSPPRAHTPAGGAARWAFVVRAYPLIACVGLVSIFHAQLLYDRARRAEARGDLTTARREIDRAAFLDYDFPLYRWRLALLGATGMPGRVDGVDGEAAEAARHAASDGRGIAALWETAGILGTRAHRPDAVDSLERAAQLAPFSALAPFYLQEQERDPALRAHWGARALLAEPRLVDACLYRTEPERLRTVLNEVIDWPPGGGGAREAALGAGWKEALRGEAERIRRGSTLDPAAQIGRLALAVDTDPATSLSLHLFHRAPWPARWPAVPLCGSLSRPDLSSAWSFDASLRPDTPLPLRRHRSVRGQVLLKP